MKTVDEVLKGHDRYDHNPEWDHDIQTVTIGNHDPTHELQIPRTEFKAERSVSLAAKVENPAAWKIANLTICNCGVSVGLCGLTRQDLRDLAEFLADYADRLKDF